MVVRQASELRREVATGAEARSIFGIGQSWGNADDSLARLGLPPNRMPGQRGVPLRHPA
jgi:hypothetical protein